MPQPTPSDVHVNSLLTNIAVSYVQNADIFIATKVFPEVRVTKQSDSYFVYTKADWLRDEAKVRPPSTESAGSGYNLSTASYTADVFAIHKDVDDQTAANSDLPLRPYEDATRFVTQRMLLRRERQWAADAFVTGVWGTSATPANLWSDQTNGDPIADVETAKRTILINTGFMPNTLVLGYDVYIQLIQHPAIIERLADSSDRLVTEQKLAQIFGISNVYVAKAIVNTAVEGETAVYAFVHGKHALLAYVASSPSILEPSAGYSFTWTGVSDGMGESIGISRIEMPWLRTTRIESQMAFDNKLVATDLAYMFVSVVS